MQDLEQRVDPFVQGRRGGVGGFGQIAGQLEGRLGGVLGESRGEDGRAGEEGGGDDVTERDHLVDEEKVLLCFSPRWEESIWSSLMDG